jgi:hypothetical protein
MRIYKTKRIQNGRFNYKIDYKQMAMTTIDEDTGKVTRELLHREVANYVQLKSPFFGTTIQFGPCKDTGDYYRQ